MSDFRKDHKTPQWIDVTELSFDVMLLLEQCHLQWFPRTWENNELGRALKYNKNVYQYFCMMTPENRVWIDNLVEKDRQILYNSHYKDSFESQNFLLQDDTVYLRKKLSTQDKSMENLPPGYRFESIDNINKESLYK